MAARIDPLPHPHSTYREAPCCPICGGAGERTTRRDAGPVAGLLGCRCRACGWRYTEARAEVQS